PGTSKVGIFLPRPGRLSADREVPSSIAIHKQKTTFCAPVSRIPGSPLLIGRDSSYSATSIAWGLGPGRRHEESVSYVMVVMDRHRPVVLRPARRQDAAAISRCVLRAYQHFVPRMGRPPAPMTDDYNQVVLRNTVWVADDGLGIQGVVELEET